MADEPFDLASTVTDEDKAKLRELLERDQGSPFHRTILAIIRDAERERDEAKRVAADWAFKAGQLQRRAELAEGSLAAAHAMSRDPDTEAGAVGG